MRVRTWFILCAMFAVSSWFLYQTSYALKAPLIREGILNESQITVKASSFDRQQVLAFKCEGQVQAAARLEDIGISEKDLRHGTTCVAGDFDGNGYLDFAFWGKPHSEMSFRPFKIVYFRGKEILKTELIENPHISYLWLFPPHSKKAPEATTFGVASLADGLIQPSDAGANSLYLFDKSTEALKLIHF